MKWAYAIKHKVRAALVLFLILTTVLLSNIYERHNFNLLEKNVSTIYEDRLMPATYIYQLSQELYKKRLLKEHHEEYTQAELYKQNSKHDEVIAKLIADYEATYLTKEEKAHWLELKKSLFNYNSQYSNAMTGIRSALYERGENDEQLSLYFNNVMTELDALSKIQTGIGKHINTDSKAVISSSILPSYLENTVLVILGIISIILLSITDKNIYPKYQHGSWN